MLGIYVTVPVACFRKGLSREYLETEIVPPPATCYGFLLSLVGETDRRRHHGSRVTAAIIGNPEQSVVLRTVWRVKSKPLGSSGNSRPDYQQLLTDLEIVVWLDSTDEPTSGGKTLESRVRSVVCERQYGYGRFGGLSFGESTHLVNDISHFVPQPSLQGKTFVLAPKGRMTLPVWVDHVGSSGTNYVTGDFSLGALVSPEIARVPCIQPQT